MSIIGSTIYALDIATNIPNIATNDNLFFAGVLFVLSVNNVEKSNVNPVIKNV